MAQFRFSVQPVLDHRLRIEEEAQKIVAALHIRLDECLGAMERLDRMRRERSAEMYERLAKGMPDHERVIYANYLTGVQAELERLEQKRKDIQAQLEAARQRLIKAMRDREVIEELRKAEYQEYLHAENVEERKLYDDLAIRTWRTGQQENLAARDEE
ncbi:MAG: flagellar export protein FliJ [Candidatus Sumerlaeota bacterium]|nr:flagellar export protein FliJ [Candidatus Sumerlaeota bacterium]